MNNIFKFFMYNVDEKIEKPKRNQISVEPLEFDGILHPSPKIRRQDKRRATVIAKVKEISGLRTFNHSKNGKNF